MIPLRAHRQAAELWAAEMPLDDEVEAFAKCDPVEWSDSGGWRVRRPF